jgi:cell division septal protein FtsQ
VVKDLRVSVQFPHAMRIQVIEQIPVGVVVVAGRRIAVAGDGTLLHDVPAPRNLAAIPVHVPPGGSRLTDRDALDAVELLAAAPDQLLRRVTQVATVAPHGPVAQLRNGPDIYFGDATRSAAKWAAAATVLADPGAAGSVYVDVTDPNRPAVGGASSSAGASPATSAAAGSSAGSQTTPTGG